MKSSRVSGLAGNGFISLVVLALGGCMSANYSAVVGYEYSSKPVTFKFTDSRPGEQKETDFESLMITSCDYGSMRLGDANVSPKRTDILKAELNNWYSSSLSGKTVDLKSYTIHFNRAAQLRGSNSKYHGGGLVSGLLNDTTVVGCEDKDLKGAYTFNELMAPYSPVVVVIDVKVDSNEFKVRHVQSAKGEFEPGSKEWGDLVGSAVLAATEKLVAEMSSKYGL